MVLLGALLLWSTSFLLSVPASAATAPTPPPAPPPAAAAAASPPADPNAVKTATTDTGDTVPGTDPLPTPGKQERSDQSCFLIVDKLQPGETTSDVVASGCAPKGSPPPVVPDPADVPAPPATPAPEQPSTGQSSATEQPTAPSSQTPAPRFSNSGTRDSAPAAAATSVPLVELYENTNFGGRSFIVYGNAGPCDASGYSISDSSTPNSTVGGVSSYKAYSNCLAQNLFNRTQYAGTNTVFNGLNQPLVGAAYDNSVLSMKLTSQNNCTTYTQTGGSVCGAVRNKYNQLGGPAKLGYPSSGEITNPDGTGKRTTFNPDISIYFSPPTGANQVQGLIFRKWGALGWETGILGYPTTDELTNPDNVGKRNFFAKSGAIYYSPSTGAEQLSGPILASWGQYGYERGPIGYPVSDEIANSGTYASQGSRRNDFERGIVWNKNGAGIYGHWTVSTSSSSTAASPSQNFDLKVPESSSLDAMTPALAAQGEADSGCPPGTYNYNGPAAPFACRVVLNGTDGYPDGIRYGERRGALLPNGTRSEGFGYFHARVDHHVGFRAQQLMIQDVTAEVNPNTRADLERFRRTFVFREGGPDGTPIDSLRVVVQRAEDEGNRSPDDDGLGLVTGYCADGTDLSMPGRPNPGGVCPSDLAEPFGLNTGGRGTEPPLPAGAEALPPDAG